MVAELRIGLTSADRRGVWAMGAPGASSIWAHASDDSKGPNSCIPNGDNLWVRTGDRRCGRRRNTAAGVHVGSCQLGSQHAGGTTQYASRRNSSWICRWKRAVHQRFHPDSYRRMEY